MQQLRLFNVASDWKCISPEKNNAAECPLSQKVERSSRTFSYWECVIAYLIR